MAPTSKFQRTQTQVQQDSDTVNISKKIVSLVFPKLPKQNPPGDGEKGNSLRAGILSQPTRTPPKKNHSFDRLQLDMGIPSGAVVKNPPANAGDTRDPGSIPGQKDPLEKETATHSSILAWKTPWTEEPDGLQSKGSQRVRHN